ncbi:lytic polysaccharide monooxygenase [Aquimarina sp. I32.4]|uniref:lytic polysaccharide monooxygenase n=1 Tax=Aquimarina sp. I32.4 TaxID=2053903 RepID=UPI000CDE7A63|nr:lytic polysaccharide monooxygenase [Aquimarina sp. I32.4]
MFKKTTNSVIFNTSSCSWQQLICTTLFLAVILSVFPHGTVTYPPSRVWNCFQEGPESPDSPPCIDAVASHGTQALYDWNEINQANANGNHRQYIMDGNLASGGRPEKYGGMDQIRPDWVSTLVSPGPLTVTWTNHAPHATAYYEVYITKESWSPDQPLTWDSLVLLVRTPPSGPERIVNIPVTLPARTGKHVIYSIWQRSDSGEAFYSASDIHFDGGGSDTQAPSTPTGLGASNATQTTANLSWSAATDNVAVTGYDVYQGDTVIATVTGTSYQVTGLTANTSYPFRVKAKDAANNQSGFSNTVTVTTLGGGSDTQPPSIPASLATSNATQTTINLSWNAATDNVAVTGYDIYQGNTVIATATGTTYQATGLTANTSYSYRIKAKDAAGNQSGFSNTATATTLPDIGGGNCAGIPQYAAGTSYSQNEEVQNEGAKYSCKTPGWCSSAAAWAYAPGTGSYWQQAWTKTGDCSGGASDTQAPSVPTSLSTSNATQTTADLSWSAATDNVAVTGYDVYQGNTVIATATSTTYQATGLTANISYSYRVKAKDAAGNQSGFSNTTTVTTPPSTGGGNCVDISQYVAGTSYNQNEEVQNAGGKYTCNIPGWCSSTAAWAFAPGTGSSWQQAWTKTGDCSPAALYSLFPTATQDIINLTIKAENASSVKIKLYDFTGKLLRSHKYQRTQKSITQDLSNLKEGLYIFKIFIDDKVYTERILKK